MLDLIPRSLYVDDFFNDYKGEGMLSTDIYEKDGKYVIEASVPGLKREDISLNYDKGYLNIAYNKTEEVENTGKKYLYRERKTSSAKRSFYLGNINEETLSASLDNGVLKITAEKQENQNKQIEIK